MSQAKFSFKLPYPVSANRYWATRVIPPQPARPARGGQPAQPAKPAMAMTYVTPEAKAYKEQVAWLLAQLGVKRPLGCRVDMHVELWPDRPQDWATRTRKDPLGWDDTVRRLDIDNARKVVYDALKGVLFVDDKMIFQDSAEVMEPDGREACVVVTIRKYVRELHPQGDLLGNGAAAAELIDHIRSTTALTQADIKRAIELLQARLPEQEFAP